MKHIEILIQKIENLTWAVAAQIVSDKWRFGYMSYSQAFRNKAMMDGRSLFDTESHVLFYRKILLMHLQVLVNHLDTVLPHLCWYLSFGDNRKKSPYLRETELPCVRWFSKWVVNISQVILKQCVSFGAGMQNLPRSKSRHVWLNVN